MRIRNYWNDIHNSYFVIRNPKSFNAFTVRPFE
jgi:hypothetical protein